MDQNANSMGSSGEFVPGALLDGVYRVEALIGRGAMGSVWRAHDLGRNASVAIKILSGDLHDERDLARFEREARLAAQVDRDGGVVRVDAFGVVAGRPYCVMELVEGRDLQQVFEREPFSHSQLAEWVEQVARTLAHCHRQGVVHRDLKPANILMPSEGRPKVADFGVARSVARSDRLTRTGEVAGTPAFMAPEQVLDSARAVDPRVDVYALGAILYRGLAGRPPFVGSVLSVLDKVVNRAPEPPSAYVPGVPRQLEAIALKGLEKAPEDRYADALELADDLLLFRSGGSSEAQRAWRHVRRREVVLTVGGALILGVALALGARAFKQRSPEQVLAAFERWDGQECEHASEGCPPEEHVLARFALGLGAGPAPTHDALDQWRAQLQAATGRASAALRERLDAAGSRVEAHQRLLGADSHGAGGNEATQRLVAALQAHDAGRLDQARAALVRRSTDDWPRAGARVWARVWSAPDPRGDWRPLRRAVTDRLARFPQGEDDRAALVAATCDVAGRWLAGRLIQGLERRGPRQLTDEVRAFGEALCATWPETVRQAVWSEARERALVLAEPRLRSELAGLKGLAEEARFVALGHALRCVAALVQPAPPIQAPGVAALLSEPFEALADWSDDSDEVMRSVAQLALAYDVAGFDAWGWGAPATAGYRRFLYNGVRDPSATDLRRELLILTVMRHDVRDPRNELVSEGIAGCFHGAFGSALLKRRPRSRAVRVAAAFADVVFGEDGVDPDARVQRSRELVESATQPGLAEDVAAPYLAELHEEFAETLEDWGETLRGAPRRNAALEVERHAREAIRLADTAGELEDAYRSLATALGRLGGDPEAAYRVLGEALGRMRGRVADATREDPANAKRHGREVEGLVKVLTSYARLDQHSGAEAVALLREAASLAVGATSWRLEERYDAVARLLNFLRDRGLFDAGEALVQEHSPQGFASEWFLREATLVALSQNRGDEARRRFRAYREASLRNGWREARLQALGRDLASKGLEVPD